MESKDIVPLAFIVAWTYITFLAHHGQGPAPDVPGQSASQPVAHPVVCWTYNNTDEMVRKDLPRSPRGLHVCATYCYDIDGCLTSTYCDLGWSIAQCHVRIKGEANVRTEFLYGSLTGN